MIKLDFTKCLASQDMINIIMKDKNLSDKEAIEFSINKHIYQKIIELGYASIAFDLWGHDDPERKWYKLSNPVIELDLSEEKRKCYYKNSSRIFYDFCYGFPWISYLILLMQKSRSLALRLLAF